MRAASTEIVTFADRPVLIVRRFDRSIDNDGLVVRSHQETACQALQVPVASVARKYQDAGGPSLRDIARLLQRWADPICREELLRHCAIHALVGNADAHAMNFSFMLSSTGEVSVAPMYDVFSTIGYPHLTTTPGMFVDDCRDIRLVSQVHLLNEAVSWGLTATRAADVLESVFSAAFGALEQALHEVRVDDETANLLRERVSTFT